MIRFPITPNVAADLVSLFREGLRRSKVTEDEGVVVYADTLSNLRQTLRRFCRREGSRRQRLPDHPARHPARP